MFAAAFGREENELNFDVTPRGIAAVKPEGDHWRIILKKPCGLAFPAGTPVVENRAGDNGIFLSGAITNGDWTEIKRTIGPKQWWPGTKYVSVIILPKQSGDAGTLFIDDLSLKVCTQDYF